MASDKYELLGEGEGRCFMDGIQDDEVGRVCGGVLVHQSCAHGCTRA